MVENFHKSCRIVRGFAVLLAGTAGPAVGAAGGGINWGSSTNDLLYDFSGQFLTAAFSWEIGKFTPGFTATAANVDLWESNWLMLEKANPAEPLTIFERSVLNDNAGGTALEWAPDKFDPPLPASNPNLFSRGERLYIWTYNAKTIASQTEWALVSGNTAGVDTNWIVPHTITDTGYQPVEYRFHNADTIIFGGLNSFAGSGYKTPLQKFTLQTALVVAPVPEPNSASTALITAALFARRIRRRY